MLLSKWLPISWILLLQVTTAEQASPNARAADFSVNDALKILRREDLYNLCAEYITQPVYATTRTVTVDSTVTQTETSTPLTTTTKTLSKGRTSTTVTSTVTSTVSSAFATDTQYSFDFVTKTRRSTTTLSATTIYTQTTHANARRALSTFPPPLPQYTAILSSACATLLALHTSYTTSKRLSTTTLTETLAEATTTTVLTKTVTRTSTSVTKTTEVYLALTTTTTTFTITTTITSTKYASTTRVPAQCAPTAYIINADQYSVNSVNISAAPEQPDALGCCELCVSTPNCQAWIWTGNPFLSPPGICRFVTGTNQNKCPDKDYNSAFYPTCLGQDQNMFSVGFGACPSEIDLTRGGCQLGQNQ